MEFTILTAFMNGTLDTLVREKAQAFLTQWPAWNETAAVAMAAAYYGKLGMVENEALTMDARRASEEIDELYYWLIEEAPCNVLGYLAEYNRSLLIDIRDYDEIIAKLDAMDWSEKARQERLIAPTKQAREAYHKDLRDRVK